MKFWYPTGEVYVTDAEFEARVCPGCGGRKGRWTGRCWRCAGQPDPSLRPMADLRHRALNALARAYGGRRPSDQVLLEWAAILSDDDLRRIRNIGKQSITWLRAQQPSRAKILLRRLGRVLGYSG